MTIQALLERMAEGLMTHSMTIHAPLKEPVEGFMMMQAALEEPD